MIPICGIAGFSLAPNSQIDARRLTRHLLLGILPRGPHATGVAWMGPDGRKMTLEKAGVPANRFVAVADAMPPRGASTVLGHTRYATKGSPKVNANNHPIASGRIVGTHNGVISNDDALFAELGAERHGKVDSEAIFALLSSGRASEATDLLPRVKGDAALAWVDRAMRGCLNLAVLEGRPLAMGQDRDGSFFYASTSLILTRATKAAGVTLDWNERVEDWSYLRVRDGVVLDYLPIPEPVKPAPSWAAQEFGYGDEAWDAYINRYGDPQQSSLWK